MAHTANFAFLAERFPVLAKFGRQAEQYWQVDANSCLMKLGMLGEAIVNLIYDTDGIARPVPDDAVHRIRRLRHEEYIDADIENILHILRKKRNLAVHENYDSAEDARALLPMAYTLAEWFYETYGDYRYEHRDFVLPEPLADSVAERAATLRQRQTAAEKKAEQQHDAEVAARAADTAHPVSATREERRKQAYVAAGHRHRTEAETRLSIDEQLRRVGWLADSTAIRYARGARPQKGGDMASAEWPTQRGPVDYMLFCGERMVGVIEAKAGHKDVPAVLDGQARDYAREVCEEDAPYTLGHWQEQQYAVPFIFATNGRPYLAQYKEKSGIWFQDLRDPLNLPQALHGWISPQGMLELLAHDAAKADEQLAAASRDELTDATGLNLRPYQVAAVEAAEKAVLAGKRAILLAMATGTGKTRTVLALIYRFLRTGRFRRILFLVDRTVLGQQAEDTFGEVRLAELQPLTSLYNVQGLADAAALAPETRVQVATVQSLVRRIVYQEGDSVSAVTDFDLVIVDEAHRGYLLDKDMSDEEELYRDQRDYMSKYRAVLEYFDAVRIALTATPALHTTEIFGQPVYTYSYREAVIDGYLVDHNAPIRIETELSRLGIHYDKGDTVAQLDPETGELLNGAVLEDELDFDISAFNRQVITENFNRVVLQEIARHFDPTDRAQGKMLIFAATDQHADLIVRLLRECYAGSVPAEAIRKITGTIENGNGKKIREAVLRFKNEQYPSIVVTVDLLTTGVDVPAITTLVFLRRVKSRILFEQMLGRATRLCPEIHKEAFDIYDPVGTYDILEKVSSMKPVAAKPQETVQALLDGVAAAKDEPGLSQRVAVERAIARLQRKAKLLTRTESRDLAESLPAVQAEAKPAKDFPAWLQQLRAVDTVQAAETLLAARALLEPLEQVHGPRKAIVIDQHADHVVATTRGYGEGQERPEDYLAAFQSWVQENRDRVSALTLICTRPQALTYSELKHLRKELSQLHFTERQLTSAWQSTQPAPEVAGRETAADVTADIISLVRRATLGTPLVSHQERIRRAVARLIAELRQRPDFTKQQENVLRKLGERFAQDENYVISPQMLDTDVRFKKEGGRARCERIFDGQLEPVLARLNTYLYEDHTADNPDGGKIA